MKAYKIQIVQKLEISLDPPPLHFFFWGYVKDRVYKTAVNGIDHPKEKNPRGCEICDCWHDRSDREQTP